MSEQTRRVKTLNANWVAGPDDDDGHFKLLIITEDDERHVPLHVQAYGPHHRPDLYLTRNPSCNYGSPPTQIRLEDVAHGLASYIYAGQVHLLRLGDGADRVVAYGTLARFTTDGLVYADGARIWSTSYDRLPLHS